jgi:RNAse (barnase) inhibitor barstar
VFERRASSIRLDLAEIRSARHLHEVLSRTFNFPEYYGCNWDAFDECIREVDLPPTVELSGFAELRQHLPREADLLQKCLEDVTSEQANGTSSIRFV